MLARIRTQWMGQRGGEELIVDATYHWKPAVLRFVFTGSLKLDSVLMDVEIVEINLFINGFFYYFRLCHYISQIYTDNQLFSYVSSSCVQ